MATLKQIQEKGFTLEYLHLFHWSDRQLYRRLILQLGLDPYSSKKIVAFWIKIQRIGFRDFIENARKVDGTFLRELVREAVKCLTFLYRPVTSKSGVGMLPCTCIVVGIDCVSLDLCICLYKDKLVKEIDEFMNDLGIMIFEDIDGEFFRAKEAKKETTQASISSDSAIDRTLFVTFSKGHPITKEQLLEYFIRKYGEDCVEAIHMSSQQTSESCLYARVIVQSTLYVTLILSEKELVQFSIHGKDIRVRRFVSKPVEQQPQTESS